MKNKLIIAGAGSGKTTFIIKKSLTISDEKILIVTYTDANEQEIKKKFIKHNGYIPENITIKTWFSFLIQHGVKPYQSVIYEIEIKGLLLVEKQSGFKYFNNNRPVYWGEDNPKEYYFSKNNKIFSDKVSKFVVEANKNTNGLVMKRIEKIYKHIFIDEVQDLAGHDLEIIKLLFKLNSNIVLVGDPRQVTYHTHFERKYKKYLDGKILEFIKEKCPRNSVEIDDRTLNKTYRNNKEICCFANSIYDNFRPCIYDEKQPTGHDGIFFVSKSDVDKYLLTFNPMQLRDSKKTKVNNLYPVMNFGESKGLTFDRVLIYPTKPIINWILNHNSNLPNQSRAKFYVAVTRAKYSVAIVFDNKDITIDGINRYIPQNI